MISDNNIILNRQAVLLRYAKSRQYDGFSTIGSTRLELMTSCH
ncbi:MAG: hypothetical protein V7L26_17675 [Nostoc sp.]